MNDIFVIKSSDTTKNIVNDLSDISKAMVQLVKDKDFDVSKMQAIMDMQVSMIDRQAKNEFNQDFFALRNEIPIILHRGKITMFDKENRTSKVVSSYVKLEDIQEALQPLLKKYNFILLHGDMDFKDNKYIIPTTLRHIGGHQETVKFISPPDKANSLKTDMQAIKSTVSFGRRVNLINLFDIKEAVDENMAIYQNQIINVEQAQELEDLIIGSGAERDKVLKFCGVDNALDVSLSSFNKVKIMLQKKLGGSI